MSAAAIYLIPDDASLESEATHAYFEKLFPPCRDQLPKDLEWLEQMKAKLDDGKDPLEGLHAIFEQCKPISYANNAQALLILENNSTSPPPQWIKRVWKKLKGKKLPFFPPGNGFFPNKIPKNSQNPNSE